MLLMKWITVFRFCMVRFAEKLVFVWFFMCSVFLSGLIVLAYLVTGGTVQAQSPMVFESMHIDIWPEYDRPDVLVIYRIQLDAQAKLPTQVSLRIPREAGVPYNLAWEDMDGSRYNLSYSSVVQEDWIKLIFTTPSALLQVEYYDPRLERGEEIRHFQYFWPGDHSVNNMSISVAQPRSATTMQIFPSFGASQPREDGLMLYSNNIGEVNAGTSFRITLRYTKTDDELSVGLQEVQPVQLLDAATPGRVGVGTVLPWVLGGLGIFLLMAGVAGFLGTHEQNTLGKRSRNRKVVIQASKLPQPSTFDWTYCNQCGRRSAPADNFCRTCGARLRVDE